MIEVLTKASLFIIIIIMVYVLKSASFFKASDFKVVSRIVLNITLPCAVVSNFNKLKIDMSLLFLIIVGIVCNFIMIGTGYLAAYKNNDNEKAINMININYFCASFSNFNCFY